MSYCCSKCGFGPLSREFDSSCPICGSLEGAGGVSSSLANVAPGDALSLRIANERFRGPIPEHVQSIRNTYRNDPEAIDRQRAFSKDLSSHEITDRSQSAASGPDLPCNEETALTAAAAALQARTRHPDQSNDPFSIDDSAKYIALLLPCSHVGFVPWHIDASRRLSNMDLVQQIRQLYFNETSAWRRFWRQRSVREIRFVKFDMPTKNFAYINEVNAWPEDAQSLRWEHSLPSVPGISRDYIMHLWHDSRQSQSMLWRQGSCGENIELQAISSSCADESTQAQTQNFSASEGPSSRSVSDNCEGVVPFAMYDFTPKRIGGRMEPLCDDSGALVPGYGLQIEEQFAIQWYVWLGLLVWYILSCSIGIAWTSWIGASIGMTGQQDPWAGWAATAVLIATGSGLVGIWLHVASGS